MLTIRKDTLQDVVNIIKNTISTDVNIIPSAPTFPFINSSCFNNFARNVTMIIVTTGESSI